MLLSISTFTDTAVIPSSICMIQNFCFEFDMNVLDYPKRSLELYKVLLVLQFSTDWLNQVYIVMNFVPFYFALLDLLVIFGQNNARVGEEGTSHYSNNKTATSCNREHQTLFKKKKAIIS